MWVVVVKLVEIEILDVDDFWYVEQCIVVVEWLCECGWDVLMVMLFELLVWYGCSIFYSGEDLILLNFFVFVQWVMS